MTPVEFIKEKVNYKDILKAKQQHQDISYFTQSQLQEDITIEYLKEWANRNYRSSDKFLNWVKSVFKTDNFLSFFKYLRYPLPSAKLINDDVKPQLRRVFHADDSIFKYSVRGVEETCHEELKSDAFDNELFDAVLFRHNDIVVQDIDLDSGRYREIISIKNILSIDCDKDTIYRVAYRSCLETENGEIQGYSYVDEFQYIFFNHDYDVLVQSIHDLGECPADWISSENMFVENNIIKKSIFSYAYTDLEEYIFLKTLQRMTEPNGAIPVTTKLKTKDTNVAGDLKKRVSDKEPMSSNMLGSKTELNPLAPSESQLQAGTVVSVAAGQNPDGSINMDVVKNYFQFHYLPVESLKYLNERIIEIENRFKASVLGDYEEQNSEAKNELQVSKGFVSKEDKLRWLSNELSRIKKLSDFKTLALLHGKDNVSVEVFFGTDFFIETLDDLFDSFKNAPNAIERRKILKRISQNRNKHNPQQAKRDIILYMLLPYASDLDFKTALSGTTPMAPYVFEMQTRFDYWISVFESEFGQIEIFFESLGEEMKESAKIIVITNLIKNIIKNETISNPPVVVRGGDI